MFSRGQYARAKVPTPCPARIVREGEVTILDEWNRSCAAICSRSYPMLVFANSLPRGFSSLRRSDCIPSCFARRVKFVRRIAANRHLLFVVACLLALSLSACAYQPEPLGTNLPGFWSGLIHGFLIALSLIESLFTHVRIYAWPNSGRLYDFGFVLGATAFLGAAWSQMSL